MNNAQNVEKGVTELALDRLGALTLEAQVFGDQFHQLSKAAGWWNDRHTGEPLNVNEQVPTKLLLIHSEISEATEGFRKSKFDDHLPHRKAIEAELADAVIRILDLGGALQLDIIGAMVEKAQYNAQRADHKVENRAKEGGKAF